MPLDLPPRTGPHPRTGLKPSQLQYSDTSLAEIVAAPKSWALSAFKRAIEEPTRSFASSARPLWLDERIPASLRGFMPPPYSPEFTHFHEDGSMHAVLSDLDEQSVISADWSIPHVYRQMGVEETLVFAPRDEDELEVTEAIVAASDAYAMSGSS